MNAAMRRFVWIRAADRCEYCRLRQNDELYYRFHIEHVTAKQHGGADRRNNLALACHHCNHHKGPNLSGVDPRTTNVVLLFNPRRQKWMRHFRFHGALIVGRTQCGRATVFLLAMNHPDRVKLRKVVIAGGERGAL